MKVSVDTEEGLDQFKKECSDLREANCYFCCTLESGWVSFERLVILGVSDPSLDDFLLTLTLKSMLKICFY